MDSINQFKRVAKTTNQKYLPIYITRLAWREEENKLRIEQPHYRPTNLQLGKVHQ